jgi:hypothetical protein
MELLIGSWRAPHALIAVVLLMTTLASGLSYAQSSNKEVQPGVDTILLESAEEIVIPVQPAHGSLRIEVIKDAQKSNRLVYRAHESGANDQVVYTVGGKEQRLAVDIRQPSGLSGKAYEEGFKALFVLFVLAVLIESALAILFNWRPFVETFNPRAVRPLISVVVAYIFVESFDLDIVTNLVNVATDTAREHTSLGKALTAMIIAGGSAGVNTLLIALGYREQKTPETTRPKPPPTVAWIAVRATGKGDFGAVNVHIGSPSTADTKLPLVGTIHGKSRTVVRYLFADRGRFPRFGGYAVPAGSEIVIYLQTQSSPKRSARSESYTVAGGAVIDIDLALSDPQPASHNLRVPGAPAIADGTT